MEEKVKFGFRQIANKTPEFAKIMFRFVLYATSALTLIINVISEIPEPIKLIITKYSLYAVTLVHGFSKMFGIQPSAYMATMKTSPAKNETE